MNDKKQTAHGKRVAKLCDQVAGFYAQNRPFKIYHGSTNSTRIQVFKRDEMIDTSHLNHVLHIDTDRKTVLVEPNVPMDKLVKATLKHGLIPPVVMEFPGITVGGGVQGGAGESSSFRYGTFQSICNEYEIITGDGTATICSAAHNSDLFYGTAGSYGTLGIMTSVELQLIQAKKYVELTYIPVSSFEESVEVLQETCKKHYDYIDGIMFSPNNGVIMVGTLTNTKAHKVQRFARAHDEWFYLHAQDISTRRIKHTESIPIVDYLFRYDRGAFWVGAYAFQIFGVPFTRFWRTVHDRMLHTRKLYEALQVSGASQRYIVQDLALPENTVVAFMEYIDKTFGIYPLWLCPLKTDSTSPFISSNLDTPLVINVGVWGNVIPEHELFMQANHSIEKTVAELGGKKWFYAHVYYDEDVFWKLYDKPTYDTLRQKYHATYLPSTYDKVRVREKFPIDVKRGLWKTLFGKARLRIVD